MHVQGSLLTSQETYKISAPTRVRPANTTKRSRAARADNSATNNLRRGGVFQRATTTTMAIISYCTLITRLMISRATNDDERGRSTKLRRAAMLQGVCRLGNILA
jgi:hypothetical protein